jgi:hypothetical protein
MVPRWLSWLLSIVCRCSFLKFYFIPSPPYYFFDFQLAISLPFFAPSHILVRFYARAEAGRHFAGEMRNPNCPNAWGIRVWRFRELHARG